MTEEMNSYIGVCPHTAGVFQAVYIEVNAKNLKEALTLIREKMDWGRYVSRINKFINGRHTAIWFEGEDIFDDNINDE